LTPQTQHFLHLPFVSTSSTLIVYAHHNDAVSVRHKPTLLSPKPTTDHNSITSIMASKTDTQAAEEALFLEWLDLLAASSGRSVFDAPDILFSLDRMRILFQLKHYPILPDVILSLHRRVDGYPAMAAFEKENPQLCLHFLHEVGSVFSFRCFVFSSLC
jgi:hypothetical protein